jgi:hypothetical protein
METHSRSSAAQHDHFGAKTSELVGVGGTHHDHGATCGGLVDQAMDVGLRSDVDALGGFIEHEHGRFNAQPARHHHFLLIPAR